MNHVRVAGLSLFAGWIALGIGLAPSQASADGMVMPEVTGGSSEVIATEQRAVLWQRDGIWEIHIQPVFDRQAGGAAWVVPFPVMPQVLDGNGDLMDQLELLTAPIFVSYCCEPSCYCPSDNEYGLGGAFPGDAASARRQS